MPKSPALKLQMWGSSLAVRIPAAIARAAGLSAGQFVEIVPVGSGGMALAERLRRFDPALHDGESMVARRVLREAM
jgi:antitoxin MazE